MPLLEAGAGGGLKDDKQEPICQVQRMHGKVGAANAHLKMTGLANLQQCNVQSTWARHRHHQRSATQAATLQHIVTLQGSLAHGKACGTAAAGAQEPAQGAGRRLRAVNDCDEIVLPGKVDHSLQTEAGCSMVVCTVHV